MPTLNRLRTALALPFRTRRRAALSLVVLAGLAALAWYGVRAYLFQRAHAAAEQAAAEFDFPAARGQLQKCLRLRPRDPEVLLQSARAARRDGSLDEAEQHLARYREVAGSTPEGRLEGTLLRVAGGRVEEDVEYLLTLVDTRHPDSELILEALAVGSVESYRFERAAFWVAQLLKLYPKNPPGRLLRAQHAVLRGRHEQAAEECREILADYPRFRKARLYLAGVLYKSRKYEEGIAVYEELRRSMPGDVEPLLGLARCLSRAGRRDDARPLVRELEDRHADSSEALLECGQFAIQDDRAGDAERLLRQALRLAPNDHEIHFQLGVCLEQLGKAEESRRHVAEFKRIEADLQRMEVLLSEVAKDPGAPGPRREIGLICLRNGQHQEGLRWLYGVLDTTPNDRPTHEALANFHRAQGNAGQADFHLLRAR